MIDSLGELLSKESIQDILCFHNVSTVFLTGENPPYHRHDGYEIYLYIRGNIRIGIEQNCYRLSRGDFVIIEPGNLHRSIVGDETPYEAKITEKAAIRSSRRVKPSNKTGSLSAGDTIKVAKVVGSWVRVKGMKNRK